MTIIRYLSSLCLLITCTAIGLAIDALADNDTQPVSIFRSRPDLEAPVLTILGRVPDAQSPGYYFVSPYQTAQDGVYIYDNDANLIYSSFGSDGYGTSHNPQTCQYRGTTHLCFYQGRQMSGWGHGHGVIIDQHYRTVRSIEPSGTYQASSDMHEFLVIDGGKSALMTQYTRSVYDLCKSPWDLCDGLGYIQSGVFQEIDVDSGEPIFTWNSLDHVHPRESWVPPSSTEISGSGQHPSSPWDYFHINSVDKNDQGDYLISARHMSTVYKISGVDGHVIWRLNGYASDYRLATDLGFSSQHDARFVSDNDTITIISMFDNASNGFNETKPRSQGLIILLDHRTKTASLLSTQDPPPETGHLSRSQGSFQLLPNGNRIMGYGSDAFVSEHDSDGEVVFYARLALTSMMNYRVHKFNDWVGRPLTKPALWTFSKYGFKNSSHDVKAQVEDKGGYRYQEDDEGMAIYMSWNGATEVSSWRIFASLPPSSATSASLLPSHQDTTGFIELATVQRSGFETVYRHNSQPAYARTYTQALDATGVVLGQSDIVDTFVPNERMRDEYCDWLACRFMPSEKERERTRLEGQKSQTEAEGVADSDGRIGEERNRKWSKHAALVLLGGLVVAAGVVTVLTRHIAARQRRVPPLCSDGFDIGDVPLTMRVKNGMVGAFKNGVLGTGKGDARKDVTYKALRLDDVYDEGGGRREQR